MFLKGFFEDTLPALRTDGIAILRMDGDMYSSTTDILVNLFEQVTPGGVVIVDDWTVEARAAVEDFLADANVKAVFHDIDASSVFFYK